MQSVPPKRLTAVWSRDVDTKRLAGRLRIIMAIREAMSANYSVDNMRLKNLLEQRSLRAIAAMLRTMLRSVL